MFLRQRIKRLPENKRTGHRDVVFYRAVMKVIKHAHQDPANKNYRLGNTLTPAHRDWRRVKDGLPPRYRLFFKFFSVHSEVYFVWLNDESTLRKVGAKTDCYRVFLSLLRSGAVPSNYAELHTASAPQCFD